ncbi:hypothetical protein HF521_018999 [Silurus meridionalis]|uniref:Uncharacterized protein n=1 Tax=Silurus meridionalis TaxID=175797 RepID=A0A8T0BKI0_SILME|nr:hypothetical protein HF521_018999 [Silurus meridionalis]
MQMEMSSTSDGRTSSSVGQVTPEDLQNGEFWMEPLKEEETDEDEYFYGGIRSSVEDGNDQENKGFQILIKEEEPKHDEFLYCEDCKSFFINKCDVHGPALFIPDVAVPLGVADRARQTLPPGLEIRKSSIPDAGLGVFNNSDTIPVGAHFGPYQGDTVEREEAMNSPYSWVIHSSEQCEKYIDATPETCSNWMRYVNCARNAEEKNLVVFQHRGGILYRCCRPIDPGHELLLWYEEDISKDLSVTFNNIWNRKCSINGRNRVLQVFSCSSCPFSYTTKIYLHKHIKRCHNEEYVRLLTSGEIKYESLVNPKRAGGATVMSFESLGADPSHTQKDPPQCSQCGKIFVQRKYLKVHQRVHTGERPYQCSQCGKSFTQQSSLRVHQRLHTGENLCQCSQCGKSFTQQIHLRAHQRVHTGEKPYQCSQCGKSFTKQINLQTHQRIHTGEKPYQCSQCGKSFREGGHLLRHQNIHNEKKPYQCSQCEKSFTQKIHLQAHQRIHTGEKPYQCSQCGKSFSEGRRLRRHQNIHNEKKPYQCLQCGKSFGELGTLTRHHRVHTGEKPYQCSHCGNRFSERGHLTTHQRIHTKEKLFHCNQCGRSFTRKSTLKQHQRIHTREKP